MEGCEPKNIQATSWDFISQGKFSKCVSYKKPSKINWWISGEVDIVRGNDYPLIENKYNHLFFLQILRSIDSRRLLLIWFLVKCEMSPLGLWKVCEQQIKLKSGFELE